MLKLIACIITVGIVGCSSSTVLVSPVQSRGNSATAFDREVVTTKTIVCQSAEGKAGVRIKEHYGAELVYDGIILCCYDNNTIYIAKKLAPVIPIQKGQWTIDTAWVK